MIFRDRIAIFNDFPELQMGGWTYGWTDGHTYRRTDPFIEMRGRLQNYWNNHVFDDIVIFCG